MRMRSLLLPFAALIGLAPSLAAACDISLPSGIPSVPFAVAGEYGAAPIQETMTVRLRNDASTACTVYLGVALDPLDFDPDFPMTQISGPIGIVPLSTLTTSGQDNASMHVIDANSTIDVTYNIAINPGWDDQAGSYSQRLNFSVYEDLGLPAKIEDDTRLTLTIPAAANIRFAGNIDRLDLGMLSATAPTTSPPFAVKVFSTADYKLDVSSENKGFLVREGGGQSIPYSMTFGGQPVVLSGAAFTVALGDPTGGLGDTSAIIVTVPAVGEALAGAYRDRVTLTVTTL